MGFDFAYSYPVDFAAALQAETGMSDTDMPWLTVWQYLSEHIKDDEGMTPNTKPTNRSNRRYSNGFRRWCVGTFLWDV